MPHNGKRTCLLTGAGGRLGTQFCELHADRLNIVAVYFRRALQVASQEQTFVDPLDLPRDLPENAHPVFGVQANLTEERDVDRLMEAVQSRFGGVDLLVNAAVRSVWGPMIASQALVDSARSQFITNVHVPLALSRRVAREFWKDDPAQNRANNRNVINISSLAGVHIFSGTGQSVYSASKAALNFLTWHMADEYREIGVRVNALAPDAFPRNISIDRVTAAMNDLDQGVMTGKVIAMKKDKDVEVARPQI